MEAGVGRLGSVQSRRLLVDDEELQAVAHLLVLGRRVLVAGLAGAASTAAETAGASSRTAAEASAERTPVAT